MGTRADVIPLAKSVSDNAFNLVLDAGSKQSFIQSLQELSSTLDLLVFKKDAGWNQLDVILLESVFQSLAKINDALEKEQVWPDIRAAIGELLPKMDGLLDTALFAADNDFWVALREVKSGDRSKYISIKSIDEL